MNHAAWLNNREREKESEREKKTTAKKTNPWGENLRRVWTGPSLGRGVGNITPMCPFSCVQKPQTPHLGNTKANENAKKTKCPADKRPKKVSEDASAQAQEIQKRTAKNTETEANTAEAGGKDSGKGNKKKHTKNWPNKRVRGACAWAVSLQKKKQKNTTRQTRTAATTRPKKTRTHQNIRPDKKRIFLGNSWDKTRSRDVKIKAKTISNNTNPPQTPKTKARSWTLFPTTPLIRRKFSKTKKTKGAINTAKNKKPKNGQHLPCYHSQKHHNQIAHRASCQNLKTYSPLRFPAQIFWVCRSGGNWDGHPPGCRPQPN